jgi:hypothetical protein
MNNPGWRSSEKAVHGFYRDGRKFTPGNFRISAIPGSQNEKRGFPFPSFPNRLGD